MAAGTAAEAGISAGAAGIGPAELALLAAGAGTGQHLC